MSTPFRRLWTTVLGLTSTECLRRNNKKDYGNFRKRDQKDPFKSSQNCRNSTHIHTHTYVYIHIKINELRKVHRHINKVQDLLLNTDVFIGVSLQPITVTEKSPSMPKNQSIRLGTILYPHSYKSLYPVWLSLLFLCVSFGLLVPFWTSHTGRLSGPLFHTLPLFSRRCLLNLVNSLLVSTDVVGLNFLFLERTRVKIKFINGEEPVRGS